MTYKKLNSNQNALWGSWRGYKRGRGEGGRGTGDWGATVEAKAKKDDEETKQEACSLQLVFLPTPDQQSTRYLAQPGHSARKQGTEYPYSVISYEFSRE